MGRSVPKLRVGLRVSLAWGLYCGEGFMSTQPPSWLPDVLHSYHILYSFLFPGTFFLSGRMSKNGGGGFLRQDICQERQ